MDLNTPHPLNHLTPHVYWLEPNHATDRPLLGAVCGTNATLVVDAGNSAAHARLFLDSLAPMNLPPLKYLAITHWHWDHVFGISTFQLPTFASAGTRRIVAEMTRQDWSDAALEQRVREGTEIEFCRANICAELPDRSQLCLKAPDISFEDAVEIDLGGVTCQIVHVGGDHSADSSVIFVVEDGVLFLGDCICQDLYSNPPRYTLPRLYSLLDRLLSFKARYYLSGHSEPETAAQTEPYLHALRTIAQVVEIHAPRREDILTELPARLNQPVDEDTLEVVDALLAGME